MVSIDSLLGMICTEAIGDGLPTDHYFDETRNPHYALRGSAGAEYLGKDPAEPELPPIRFTLQLIEGEDGKPYWVE